MAKKAKGKWFVARFPKGADLCRRTSPQSDSGWPIATSSGYGGKRPTGVGILYRCARLLNAEDERRREERTSHGVDPRWV